MSYEIEMTHNIYSNCGYYFEVRPDPDGLGLVEIRYFNSVDEKEPRQNITLTEDSIPLIIKALESQLRQIQETKR